MTPEYDRTRKQTIAPDLIAEGLIRAPKDLELFIASFNSFDPLTCFMDTTDPKEITLQRMRGELVAIYASRARADLLSQPSPPSSLDYHSAVV